MAGRVTGEVTVLTRSLLLAALFSVATCAQWVNYKVPGVPRTKDGKPNLTAVAPRLNGRPDLSGLWQTEFAAPGEIERIIPGLGDNAVPGDDARTFSRYFFNVMADYKPGEIGVSAEAERIQKERAAEGEAAANSANCLPAGPPLVDIFPSPRRFVQAANILAILSEGDPPRQIHLDGRKLPVDPQPAWEGYSVGHWEKDTLVIETIGVNERAPLDGMGHPRSAASKLTERLRRRDYGHIDVQVQIDDPYYSMPIIMKYTQALVPDDDLLEWVCAENEKDVSHLR
jgi:hypothetical protein